MLNKRKRKLNKPSGTGSISAVLPKVIGDPSFISTHFSRSRISVFATENRRNPTPAEKRLESILNNLNGGVLRRRFTSQYVISGKWIVDFFIPEIRLAIEVDGSSHQIPEREAKDLVKQKDCDRFDITLLRISNEDVFGNESELVVKLRGGWKRAKSRKNKLIGRAY